MEAFDVLDCHFQRDGKGVHGTEKTLRKGLESWWRDGYVYRAKSVPLNTKCHRVVSHLFSTALYGCVDWLWSVARTTKIHQLESRILRLTFRLGMRAEEDWVDHRRMTTNSYKSRRRPPRVIRAKRRMLNPQTMAEPIPKILESRCFALLTMAVFQLCNHFDLFWDGGLRHGGETEVRKMKMDPASVSRWKHKFEFHKRGVMWDACDKIGRRGGRLHTEIDMVFATKRKCSSHENAETTDDAS